MQDTMLLFLNISDERFKNNLKGNICVWDVFLRN